MRMLLKVKIPHEEFNKAVRDGSVGHKLRRILEDTKPEAVYFTEQHGQRGAIIRNYAANYDGIMVNCLI